MKIPQPLTSLLMTLIAVFSPGIPAGAQTPPAAGPLTVKVEGLKTTGGKLVVSVFRQSDDIFGKPFLRQTTSISTTTAVVKFPDVPYSTYSVFAFHDINDNGILDHNSLHLPKEPMGWSNRWHFGLFTGMPTFEKTRFLFLQGDTSITIALK